MTVRRTGKTKAPLPMTLDDLFSATNDHLVGVWRFRERGRPSLWCATFVIDGFYYDVSGKRTIAGVLRAVCREIARVKRATAKLQSRSGR